MSNIHFPKDPIDENIFESDLVLKIKVPSEKYKKRSTYLKEVSLIVTKPDNQLVNGYNAAFKQLFDDMEYQGDDFGGGKDINQRSQGLKIRTMASLRKINSDKNK